MKDKNLEKLSKPTLKDIFYAIAKGAISIPIGGAIASELIPLLVVSPSAKRRDEWVNGKLEEAFRLIAQKVDVSTFSTLR